MNAEWSPRRDAARIPATTLPPPIPDRDHVQLGEAQALGSCAGPLAAHTEAPSAAARTEFQYVPVETSLPLLRMSTEPSDSKLVSYENSRKSVTWA